MSIGNINANHVFWFVNKIIPIPFLSKVKTKTECSEIVGVSITGKLLFVLRCFILFFPTKKINPCNDVNILQ